MCEMEKGAPRIELLGAGQAASPEQAAAAIAALERFMRDTAPASGASDERPDRWRQAALLEGVSKEPILNVPHSWINA
jgi:hypothetical protein